MKNNKDNKNWEEIVEEVLEKRKELLERLKET